MQSSIVPEPADFRFGLLVRSLEYLLFTRLVGIGPYGKRLCAVLSGMSDLSEIADY